MTKMHFNFAGVSFYNYPYTFGYLFALGIYATKEKLAEKFHQAYVDLLRDSGRMSAEDLVQSTWVQIFANLSSGKTVSISLKGKSPNSKSSFSYVL